MAARRLYSEAATTASLKGNRRLAQTVKQKMHLEIARYHLSRGDKAQATIEIEEGFKAGKGRMRFLKDLESLRDSIREEPADSER